VRHAEIQRLAPALQQARRRAIHTIALTRIRSCLRTLVYPQLATSRVPSLRRPIP
jgi:hypothetical protein